MAASYKTKARRHMLMAEREHLTDALDKAKAAMEKASDAKAFHAASAKFEELSGEMARVKKRLKRKKKASGGFLGSLLKW